MQILSRVAETVVEKPDGIVREVIFPFERGGIALCVRPHRTTTMG
jgi:hypothetical protein